MLQAEEKGCEGAASTMRDWLHRAERPKPRQGFKVAKQIAASSTFPSVSQTH